MVGSFSSGDPGMGPGLNKCRLMWMCAEDAAAKGMTVERVPITIVRGELLMLRAWDSCWTGRDDSCVTFSPTAMVHSPITVPQMRGMECICTDNSSSVWGQSGLTEKSSQAGEDMPG